MENQIERIRCNICNKYYSSSSSLWNHNKKFHSEPPQNCPKIVKTPLFAPQFLWEDPDRENNNEDIKRTNCQFCNKLLARYDSLLRHEKICKSKDTVSILKEIKKTNEHIKKSEEQNLILVEKIKELENKIIIPQSNTITNSNNQITNTNTNNGTINNNSAINFVRLGTEDVSRLTPEEQKNIIDKGNNSLFMAIEKVNFNPKFPEYQTIKISNLAKKTCKKYDERTKKFIEADRDEVLEQLVGSRSDDLKEFIYDHKEPNNKHHKAVENLIICLDDPNTDKKRYNSIMNDTKLFVYNKTNQLKK